MGIEFRWKKNLNPRCASSSKFNLRQSKRGAFFSTDGTGLSKFYKVPTILIGRL